MNNTASEHAMQASFCDWWSYVCKRYKVPEFALYAVPNGGKRLPMTAMKLKAEGVRAGIPDLHLAVPTAVAPGLWIEMKKKPNKPSKEQEAVILYLRQRGYHVVVAYSCDEAMKAIVAYLS